MRMTDTEMMEESFEEEFGKRMPTRAEVCPGCNGKGSHVNRAVDGHGISPEEFAEDPDFAEAYFAGVYDVVCDTCGGDNVIWVYDESLMTDEEIEYVRDYQQSIWESYEISRQERMMGA